jgi:hypothetical protein
MTIVPPTKPFVVKPWREIFAQTQGDSMPSANAKAKKSEMKAAEKKLAGKGVTKPRHRVLTSNKPPLMSQGVDGRLENVVESTSGQAITLDQFFNPNHQRKEDMNTTTTPEAQAAKEAATKAKMEAKAAKLKAAQDKKEAAEKKAQAAAEAKAAKLKAAQEKKDAAAAAKAAKAAERANRPPRDPGVVMANLGERTKAGHYVKGANGQLRSNDDLAVALESIPAKKMVPFLLQVTGLTENKYAALNYGQQSMNLRNRLRGMVRKGAEVNGQKLTIDVIKSVRDEGSFTVDETAAAKAA